MLGTNPAKGNTLRLKKIKKMRIMNSFNNK